MRKLLDNAMPDILCTIGLGILTWALWRVSPTLAIGFVGVLLVAIGVWMHAKRRHAEPPRRENTPPDLFG